VSLLRKANEKLNGELGIIRITVGKSRKFQKRNVLTRERARKRRGDLSPGEMYTFAAETGMRRSLAHKKKGGRKGERGGNSIAEKENSGRAYLIRQTFSKKRAKPSEGCSRGKGKKGRYFAAIGRLKDWSTILSPRKRKSVGSEKLLGGKKSKGKSND